MQSAILLLPTISSRVARTYELEICLLPLKECPLRYDDLKTNKPCCTNLNQICLLLVSLAIKVFPNWFWVFFKESFEMNSKILDSFH